MTNRLIVIRTLMKHGALLRADIATLGSIDLHKVIRVLDRYPYYFAISPRGLVSIAESSFERAAELRAERKRRKATKK